MNGFCPRIPKSALADSGKLLGFPKSVLADSGKLLGFPKSVLADSGKLLGFPNSQGSKTQYIAYERLYAFSVVFIINDRGIFKVYSSQKLDILDDGFPFFVGIVQCDACPGDIVEVVESGLTRVILATTLPNVSNQNLFIAKSDTVSYATCADDPIDTRYVRRGFYLYLGRIPAISPGTPPVSTTHPVCYLSFSLVPI